MPRSLPPLLDWFLSNPKSRVLRVLAAVFGSLLLFAAVTARLAWPDFETEVVLSAQLEPGERPSVFFSSAGPKFVAADSTVLFPRVLRDLPLPQHRALLRTRDPVTHLRLDFGARSGPARVGTLEVRTAHGRWQIDPPHWREMSITSQEVQWPEAVPSGADSVIGQRTGPDPYVVFAVPDEARDVRAWPQRRAWRWLASPWVWVGGIVLLLMGVGDGLRRARPVVHQRLRRWSDHLSRATALPLPPGALLLLMVLPVVLLVYVGLQWHQSSIGVWQEQYGHSLHEPRWSWGEAQAIRSDEWYVSTPWLLNQVQTGMTTHNPNIGPPGAPLITGVPVAHPTVVAQPQFWGFWFLDLERGFSWWWGVRCVSLFAALFLLALVLTKGRTLVSVGTAVAVIGSSQVQWWYGSWLTENIVGCALALVGLHVWANSRRPGWMLAGAVLAALACMHVVLQPYLPTVLSLGYLGLVLSVAFVWEAARSGALVHRTGVRVVAATVGLVVLAGLFWSYYTTARPAIDAVLNTVYPGQRVLPPGQEMWRHQLVGLFDFWRDRYETPLPTNPSESSRPLLLWPLVTLAALTLGRRYRWPAPFWALLLYLLVAVLWMSASLPSEVAQALGSIGLNKVPAHRFYGGLCVASWCLSALVLAQFSEQGQANRWETVVHALLALFAVTAAWALLKPENPGYYNVERLVAAAVVVVSLVWAVYRAHVFMWLVGVLLAVWMPLQVNPVSSGLQRMLDKELLQHTRRMDPHLQEVWAVFDGSNLSQLLRANGHTVITGTYFAPRVDMWQHFDPQQREIAWWNNYGELSLVASATPGELAFRRQIRPGLDAIQLHPCHPALRSARVTRWVVSDAFPAVQAGCLTQLAGFKPLGLQVYGRSAAAPGF